MSPLTSTTDQLARLGWLIRLRWMAMAGVGAGVLVSALGWVPGVNRLVLLTAILGGALSNSYLSHRRRSHGETDARHRLQALLDTGALTLVIWGAGGAACPFMGFYVFPLLLAAQLGGRGSLLPTAVAVSSGVGFQFAATLWDPLAVGEWNPTPGLAPWLDAAALVLTVGMAAYFAARFTEAVRQQIEARQHATTLLRVGFEGLDAAVEVVEGGQVVWQNKQAEALLQQARAAKVWSCPGRTPGCNTTQCRLLSDPQLDERSPCRFSIPGRGPERIFEVLAFPLPPGAGGRHRFMALYVDRTRDVLAERRLLVTERLASLGRAVGGVAHELNTPLSTIQTLGRDLLDATASANLDPALDQDLTESAQMIVSEVQRCRRITHALLGRAERLDVRAPAEGCSVEEALNRAIAVVFTRTRERVELKLGEGRHARFPLDPLVQILVNLLQNAADASDGAPITAAVERHERRLNLSIRDHGEGLSEEVQQRLFEPFFTTKPPGQGTGLGLYTSYSLAKELGGELSLENHADGGVLARLNLPDP